MLFFFEHVCSLKKACEYHKTDYEKIFCFESFFFSFNILQFRHKSSIEHDFILKSAIPSVAYLQTQRQVSTQLIDLRAIIIQLYVQVNY